MENDIISTDISEIETLIQEFDLRGHNELLINGNIIDQNLRTITLLPDAKWPDYNNGYDKQADQLEPGSRERYLSADKLYFFHTKGLNLKINSGKRDVRKQAELWIKWKEGALGYNPANLPGCSFHNYGVAVDIIRDHQAIADATLKQFGWERTHRDEEWHYDCLESPAHPRVEGLIATLRGGKSGQWASAWFSIRQDQISRQNLIAEFSRRMPQFEQDLANVKLQISRHNQEVAVFNAQLEKWRADKVYWLARIDDFNRRVQKANALAQQINSTPPGPTRDALIREWSALRDQIEQERPLLESGIRELNQRADLLKLEGDRLAQQKLQIEAVIARLEKEQHALQGLLSQIDGLAEKIKTNEGLMSRLLTDIEGIVSTFEIENSAS